MALMDNQYRIKSNRESGDGRYDISLIPREKKYPGIIMELKWKSNFDEKSLEKFEKAAQYWNNKEQIAMPKKAKNASNFIPKKSVTGSISTPSLNRMLVSKDLVNNPHHKHHNQKNGDVFYKIADCDCKRCRTVYIK